MKNLKDDSQPRPRLLPVGGTMHGGTTLLLRILNSHPGIEMFTAELRALMWPQVRGWSHMGRAYWHLLKEPLWRRPPQFRRELYRYLYAFAQTNGPLRQPGYEGIRRAFNESLAKPGTLYVGDKYPLYVFAMAEISRQPDSVCLTVLRDPRDVVSALLKSVHEGAWKGKRWARSYATVEQCCDYWNRTAREIQRLLEISENVHLVVYDDLVRQPGGTLDTLARFLQVDASGFEYREVHAASIGKHRRYLAPHQITEIEERTGPLMRALGFGD